MAFAIASLAFLTPGAAAATGPLFAVTATWGDSSLQPGSEGQFHVQARNIGDTAAGGEGLVIRDELPAGVTATAVHWPGTGTDYASFCTGTGTSVVTCTVPASKVADLAPAPSLSASGTFTPLPSGYLPPLYIEVEVSPSASGTATNTATIEGGGAPQPETVVGHVSFSTAPAAFGVLPGSFFSDGFTAAFPFGAPSRQAGDRPFEQRVRFDFNAATAIGVVDGTREITAKGLVRTVEVTLPRGFIGNPEATPKCDPTTFAEPGLQLNATACPTDTQVGYINVALAPGGGNNYGAGVFKIPHEVLNRVPIYNLEPPKGVPADFGFSGGGLVLAHIYPELDPAQDYAIKTVSPNISTVIGVQGAEVTFWGVPADPAHDRFRYYTEETKSNALGAPWGSAPIRPLLTNPADCGFNNGGAKISAESYAEPGHLTSPQDYPTPYDVTGCEDPRFRFEPDIAMQPTDRSAGAPTGLDVHLEVPQRNDEVKDATDLYASNDNVKAIATPPIKKAVVTFPEGMTLSPSAAQGLGSCSFAQISLGTNRPVTCPDNSQYGKLILHTPILPATAQPEGFIYIAKQGDNAFHNFLSVYLVIQEPERGILIKIPGKLELNPDTGQITATFDDLPQFPVSDMQMTFKGGVRAGLVNPSTCGPKTIRAEFFSWQDPQTPHVVDNSYAVTQKPDGSPCVNSLGERQFKPALEAGTANPIGGSFSPFIFRLTRTDDDQEFSQLGVTLPQGLAAKFAGVGICSDAAIAMSEARTAAGDGLLEQLSPSCPASSEIGSTQVGAGVGVPLTYVPGKVYLAGPYKGAPLSIVVVSPAIVGPYDLGVIAVRTALRVNPVTAQGSAASDPFPQIFQGIPVRIRDIRLRLDRPSFTLNPTSCAQKQIAAHVTGTGGSVSSTSDDTGADLSERFQAADCASLPFKPKLSFHLFGGTRRGSHPRLKAVLKARPGDANIAGASVALPHSEFLDQGHIGTVCTRVQFSAHSCPAASVYGFAVASTPLFDQPLRGPVYLRSSANPLPDLVAALRGPDAQPVEVELSGRVDSVNGGIRNTFDFVPDAPVTEFTLTMQGGKKGLLVNSTSLCKATNRATAKFIGQNGKSLVLRPAMQNGCSKAKKHKRADRR